MNANKKKLSAAEQEELLTILQQRFQKNSNRHPDFTWDKVSKRLQSHPDKLWSLAQMELSGGEPDVVAYEDSTGAYIFYDCSAESPKGRRSICYDHEALDARKENKPNDSAIQMATDMGVTLLTEEEYRNLQLLGVFDTKTSSWVQTPPAIRKLGGATFCDRRYQHVFFYHNGAESYYAARGFRASLRI